MVTRWSGPLAAKASVRCFSSSVRAGNLSHPLRRRRFSLLDHPLIATPPPSAEEAVNNILYNAPPQGPSPVTRHILNCLVTNEPGVLSRVSGTLAGRNFNIDSLVVAKTEIPDLSRMTVVLRGRDKTIEQARRQLEDLVPVWAVLDYTHSKIVERELLLVKVSTLPLDYQQPHQQQTLDTQHAEKVEEGAGEHAVEEHDRIERHALSPLLASGIHRQSITELARLFRARIVHVTYDNMILELCSSPDKVEAFLKLLKPYGIVEATRSGSIALAKSPVDGQHDDGGDPAADESGAVDVSQLPPG
ncbi:small subunit of acetolactate synthase-domain-containing protein [Zopfochytrium polystomum]|nr:small subunit of acetolactate synthase-domain-containing protein [Zopfochytrium polystomum]